MRSLVAALAVLLGIDLGVLTTIVAPALGVVGDGRDRRAAGLGPQAARAVLTSSSSPTSRRGWCSGSYALAAFAAVSGIWLLRRHRRRDRAARVRAPALTCWPWLAVPAGALVAGYTAFLFGQAEGRDLWQSPLLFWHLLVQAVMVGGGALAAAACRRHRLAAGSRLSRARWSSPPSLHVLMLAGGVRRAAREQAARRGRAHDHPRPVRAGLLARRRSPWPSSPAALAAAGGRHQVLALAARPGSPSRSPCSPTRASSSARARTSRCPDA